MLTRPKPTNVLRSGEISAGGFYPLSFVILEQGLTLITQESLFRYLEIESDNALISNGLPSPKLCVFYDVEGDADFGVPPLELPAFCINIIELNAQTRAHKQVAFNAMMLLMFLTSSGINKLISAENVSGKSRAAMVVSMHTAGR